MNITIIYDNTSFRKDLRHDWGFSALIEVNGRKILFDTGAKGSVLFSNMVKLGIDPAEIDDVFISHHHYDHTGGLSAFLDKNREITLWTPDSFRGVKDVKKVVRVDNACEMYDGIYSTGELEGIEHSLCIKTSKGVVIITGCSHPEMENILNAASRFGKIYGITGGLHGTRPEALRDLNLICATHCTEYKEEIKALYPESYIEGGAGKSISF